MIFLSSFKLAGIGPGPSLSKSAAEGNKIYKRQCPIDARQHGGGSRKFLAESTEWSSNRKMNEYQSPTRRIRNAIYSEKRAMGACSESLQDSIESNMFQEKGKALGMLYPRGIGRWTDHACISKIRKFLIF